MGVFVNACVAVGASPVEASGVAAGRSEVGDGVASSGVGAARLSFARTWRAWSTSQTWPAALMPHGVLPGGVR
jgi:hypothetical protein